MIAKVISLTGICSFLLVVFPGLQLVNAEDKEEEPIPDKVGAEIHMSKQERTTLKKVECNMCKAVLREMHAEVKKHGMTSKGWGSEVQVWETSNAMCLAMLQKYKLDLTKAKLERKTEEEEEDGGMSAGGDPQLAMRAMLVLKMGCQRWLEDNGGDTSGFIYKRVQEQIGTPEDSAKEYCHSIANQCGKGKKEKQVKSKEMEKERETKRRELRKKEDKDEEKAKAENPFESLPSDSKFGLQRMLEMARDDPLHYMEDDAKLRIQQGQRDLRCDVCRAALEHAHSEVMKRPRSMQREYDILPFVEGACEGGKDTSVPAYFGVEPPPLPPLWTDKYRPKLDKKQNQYALKRFPKKAAKKRAKWRALTASGAQKPPPQDEHEGDMMMTMTCKDVMEPARTSEVLYEQMVACSKGSEGCDAVLTAARMTCRGANDATCTYNDAGKKSEEL